MVVHAYYPGRETRVQRQAGALIAAGYQVDVVCLRLPDEPRRDSIDGVEIYRLPVRRHQGVGRIRQLLEYTAFGLVALGRLTALHLRRHYRVVQIHGPPDMLAFCALPSRLMGVRVMLDLHDLMPEFYLSRFGGRADGWALRLVRWQESLACRIANHVVTVTEQWRQALLQRGLPARKCSVVMNLADASIFSRRTVERRRTDARPFRLIYHGTLVWRYGVDLALRALAQLCDDRPQLHLTIHGGGELLPDLRRLADQLGLNGCVDFSTVSLPIEQLPGLITSADLALVPYRRDPFTDAILPTKLMEYAALGMPVAAARTYAIEAHFDDTMVEFFRPESIEELANAILRLCRDEDRRLELAANISRFVQRNPWREKAAEYVDLVAAVGAR